MMLTLGGLSAGTVLLATVTLTLASDDSPVVSVAIARIVCGPSGTAALSHPTPQPALPSASIPTLASATKDPTCAITVCITGLCRERDRAGDGRAIHRAGDAYSGGGSRLRAGHEARREQGGVAHVQQRFVDAVAGVVYPIVGALLDQDLPDLRGGVVAAGGKQRRRPGDVRRGHARAADRADTAAFQRVGRGDAHARRGDVYHCAVVAEVRQRIVLLLVAGEACQPAGQPVKIGYSGDGDHVGVVGRAVARGVVPLVASRHDDRHPGGDRVGDSLILRRVVAVHTAEAQVGNLDFIGVLSHVVQGGDKP